MGPKTWRQLIARWLFAIFVLIALLYGMSIVADYAHNIPALFHAMIFGGNHVAGME